jgi:hypothetical protein
VKLKKSCNRPRVLSQPGRKERKRKRDEPSNANQKFVPLFETPVSSYSTSRGTSTTSRESAASSSFCFPPPRVRLAKRIRYPALGLLLLASCSLAPKLEPTEFTGNNSYASFVASGFTMGTGETSNLLLSKVIYATCVDSQTYFVIGPSFATRPWDTMNGAYVIIPITNVTPEYAFSYIQAVGIKYKDASGSVLDTGSALLTGSVGVVNGVSTNTCLAPAEPAYILDVVLADVYANVESGFLVTRRRPRVDNPRNDLHVSKASGGEYDDPSHLFEHAVAYLGDRPGIQPAGAPLRNGLGHHAPGNLQRAPDLPLTQLGGQAQSNNVSDLHHPCPLASHVASPPSLSPARRAYPKHYGWGKEQSRSEPRAVALFGRNGGFLFRERWLRQNGTVALFGRSTHRT